MPTLMFISNAPFLGPTLVSQEVSVDMDGGTESLIHNSEVDIGIANNWSLLSWNKRTASDFTGGGGCILDIDALGNNNNTIGFRYLGAQDTIRVFMRDSGGTTFKLYDWDNFQTLDQWISLLSTWDGTTLLLYIDGTDQAPSTKFTDDSGTMTSSDRRVGLGARASGGDTLQCINHSAAIWNVTLSSPEVTAVYNSGNGGEFDLANNSSSYVSSANLLHWWRLGLETDPVSAIGQDYGKHTTLINVMDDAVDITADDVVVDSPP